MSDATLNASTGAWPFGDATIVVNPAKRKKVAHRIMLTLLVGFAGYALVLDDYGPVMKWAARVSEQEQAAKIEPTMRQLADQGMPEAALWLAKHYPETESSRLDALVQSGSGEAAYLMAGIRWREDEAEGKRLLDLSAARGYAPAVAFAERNAH